jgi:hypothetical protein
MHYYAVGRAKRSKALAKFQQGIFEQLDVRFRTSYRRLYYQPGQYSSALGNPV